MNYTVVVAHIGQVYRGNSHRYAVASYNYYKNIVERSVILFNKDKPIREFDPKLLGETVYVIQ